jgi:hypothetical protein
VRERPGARDRALRSRVLSRRRGVLYLPQMQTGRGGAPLPQWSALCNDAEIGRAHYLDAAMALARIHAGVALEWAGDIATMGSVARLPDGRVYRVEPSGPREDAT